MSPNEEDENPFRYAGQYYDTETGTYYLRARYYAPSIGRFTQQDSWGYANPKDPLSLNLYVYCGNNPIKYVDYTGNAWETVFDVLGLAWSLVDMIKDPSFANATFLLWDLVSIVVPFLPGSYAGKSLKLVTKVDDAYDAVKLAAKSSDVVNFAVKNGNVVIGTYTDVRKWNRAIGQGFQSHHLIEKRFATIFGITDINKMLSMSVDHDTHVAITTAFRQGELAYGLLDYKPQAIWDRVVEIYTNLGLEELLPLIKENLEELATKGLDDIDWRGVQ